MITAPVFADYRAEQKLIKIKGPRTDPWWNSIQHVKLTRGEITKNCEIQIKSNFESFLHMQETKWIEIKNWNSVM